MLKGFKEPLGNIISILQKTGKDIKENTEGRLFNKAAFRIGLCNAENGYVFLMVISVWWVSVGHRYGLNNAL